MPVNNVDLFLGGNKTGSTGDGQTTYLISGAFSSDSKSDLIVDNIGAASYCIDTEFYTFPGSDTLAVDANITNGLIYLDTTGVNWAVPSSVPDNTIIIASFDSDSTKITRYNPYLGKEDIDLSNVIEDRGSYIIPGTTVMTVVDATPTGLNIAWAGTMEVMLTNLKAGAATKNIINTGNVTINSDEVAYVTLDRHNEASVLPVNISDIASANIKSNSVVLFYNINNVIYAPRVPGFQAATAGYVYDPSDVKQSVHITYDNSISGLSAINVKLALDELKNDIDNLPVYRVFETKAPISDNNPATLTFAPLSVTAVEMIVNGQSMIYGVDYGFTVDVSGNVTWYPETAGYTLKSTDVVSYRYSKLV